MFHGIMQPFSSRTEPPAISEAAEIKEFLSVGISFEHTLGVPMAAVAQW